jgi:TonB family protein
MTLLIDAAVRCSVLLFVGLTFAALPGRRSAAVRHAVLAGAMLASGVVVPLAYVIPTFELDWRATPSDGASPEPVIAVVGTVAALVRAEALPTGLVWFAIAVWGAGAVTMLSALLNALFRIRSIAAAAVPVADDRLRQLAASVATHVGIEGAITLLHAEGPVMPATWGLHPRIMLPADAAGWTDERVHAVLCHELAHIRRRDWIVQIAAETLRAVYWFNPLLWLACARLRWESERACDDVVLRMGMPPGSYARHLIDLARSHAHREPVLATAMPMARASSLQGRITAMLNPDLNRNGLSPRAAALIVFGLFAVTLPVAAYRASQESPLSLAGAVYDMSGAAVPQVELTLEDAQHVKLQTISDASGHFDFGPVAPGDYVIDAALPGFRRLRYDLTLLRAPDWNLAITLQVGEVRETISVRASRGGAPATPRAESKSAPVRVGGNLRPPKKIKDVRPEYPASMQDAGLEGLVPLEAVIGRDGTVSSLRVLSAKVHPDLAAAAMHAVRQWRFEPTLLNGVPVDVMMTVTVAFRLD